MKSSVLRCQEPQKNRNVYSRKTNQKRVVLGNREKIFEIIQRYIENIFSKINEVIRRFSFVWKGKHYERSIRTIGNKPS